MKPHAPASVSLLVLALSHHASGTHGQMEKALLDGLIEGLFEMDMRRVNSKEAAQAMDIHLVEGGMRSRQPLREMFIPFINPRWVLKVWSAQRTLHALCGRIADTILAQGTPPEDETNLWACLARIKDKETESCRIRHYPLVQHGYPHTSRLCLSLGMFSLLGV